jgi:hypothetical protein
MPIPQRVNFLVERASCPFLRMMQYRFLCGAYSYANPAFSSPDYCFYTGKPGVFLLTSSPSFAVPIDRLVAPEPLKTLAEKPFAQVNSVSQLSDVKPTDWAFQALQSLVERYGCIVGYPDGTYRGNRAMTRYEFAAGLNSCLDRVSELIPAEPT